MSSNDVFWGLTSTDFKNNFTNAGYVAATLFAGAFVASLVTAVAKDTLGRDYNETTYKKFWINVAIGFTVGLAVSIYVAHCFNPITFVAEKALKFLVLSLVTTGFIKAASWGHVIPIIALGGVALGPFGSAPLYCAGAIGAWIGSTYIAGQISEND